MADKRVQASVSRLVLALQTARDIVISDIVQLRAPFFIAAVLGACDWSFAWVLVLLQVFIRFVLAPKRICKGMYVPNEKAPVYRKAYMSEAQKMDPFEYVTAAFDMNAPDEGLLLIDYISAKGLSNISNFMESVSGLMGNQDSKSGAPCDPYCELYLVVRTESLERGREREREKRGRDRGGSQVWVLICLHELFEVFASLPSSKIMTYLTSNLLNFWQDENQKRLGPKFRTKTKQNTMNPDWGEQFSLPVKVEAGCSLVLKVKDENTLGKDSWQGLVKVPLKKLIENARSSKAKKEFKLTGFLKNGAKAQGVIYIEFAYRTKAELLSSDFDTLDEGHKGFLTREDVGKISEQQFNLRDINKDGVVSREEFEAAFERVDSGSGLQLSEDVDFSGVSVFVLFVLVKQYKSTNTDAAHLPGQTSMAQGKGGGCRRG